MEKIKLLLGKYDAVEEYVDNELKIDVDKDVMYCPSILTHFTEYGQYIDAAKSNRYRAINTQSLEMIDLFLESDLEFDVITVRKYGDEIKTRTLSKKDVIDDRNAFNFDPRK